MNEASSIDTGTGFDPCKIFPARVKKAVWDAEPSKGKGGASDMIKHHAYLPTKNSAYGRTVRLHEALHAIYSQKPTKERIKSKEPYTMLEQALEDARLHLNCARTSGAVRRDELATALIDIHGATSKRYFPPANMDALLALRSAAILSGKEHKPHASARLEKLCAKVSPEYRERVGEALALIAKEQMKEAHELLKPYFLDKDETQESFPFIGKEVAGGGEEKEFADVSFTKLDGRLTSDAAEMLSKERIKAINDAYWMPKMHVHQLFAQHMIPTTFGEDNKHVISGSKIHAKKLATIVGPHTPRLFLKTIRRNGGTVVIDASGSMSISPERLLELVRNAPAATIAFYNAPSDSHKHGNMWIFAHKGKRAADLSGVVPWDQGSNPYRWGSGNVIDFQVLQWLLAMPAPRYILTDGEFTGSFTSIMAGKELLHNAIARKKLTQITSMKEMAEVLAKGGKND